MSHVSQNFLLDQSVAGLFNKMITKGVFSNVKRRTEDISRRRGFVMKDIVALSTQPTSHLVWLTIRNMIVQRKWPCINWAAYRSYSMHDLANETSRGSTLCLFGLLSLRGSLSTSAPLQRVSKTLIHRLNNRFDPSLASLLGPIFQHSRTRDRVFAKSRVATCS